MWRFLSGSQPVPSKKVKFASKPLAFVYGLVLLVIAASNTATLPVSLVLWFGFVLSSGFLKPRRLVVVQHGSSRFEVGFVSVEPPYL